MPNKTDPVARYLSSDEIDKAIADNIFEPLGTKVIVYVPPIEEKSDGGIILASKDERVKEHRGLVHGYLVAKGPEAWADYPQSNVEIRARVSFARYEGRMPDNEAEYRVMQDQDIDCIVKEVAT